MQLMPANIEHFGVSDPFDPAQNIEAGTALLEEELERFGDVQLALAAYNAGSPKVMEAIKKAGSTDFTEVSKYLPDETKNYVPKVLKKLTAFA
jgi:soluble lytic murein transglycosylase-like protein